MTSHSPAKRSKRFAFEEFTPVLHVPSIIMPHCRNMLINPLHADHAKLSIVSVETHPLDPRFLTYREDPRKYPVLFQR